ncbi:MAG TPA: hypothetical protein VMG37_13835 [Solirubrobacteraceae bacterium]|nr:hypothetical protein [Solirubrobacteraceae bacterium]
MSSSEQVPTTRECPYCKEEVLAEAVRCKHCHASIPAVRPDHHGVCPYCKESIHPDAVRCKHCHADLVPSRMCGCGQATPARMTRAVASGASGGRQRKTLMRAAGHFDPVREPEQYPDPAPGCAATDKDEDGLWCFIEASEHYCIYELCVPAVGPTLPT